MNDYCHPGAGAKRQLEDTADFFWPFRGDIRVYDDIGRDRGCKISARGVGGVNVFQGEGVTFVHED